MQILTTPTRFLLIFKIKTIRFIILYISGGLPTFAIGTFLFLEVRLLHHDLLHPLNHSLAALHDIFIYSLECIRILPLQRRRNHFVPIAREEDVSLLAAGHDGVESALDEVTFVGGGAFVEGGLDVAAEGFWELLGHFFQVDIWNMLLSIFVKSY